MPSTVANKNNQLRKNLRQQRRSLRPASQVIASQQLSQRLLQVKGVLGAKRIATYQASDGEIQLDHFIQQRRKKSHIKFYSPKINVRTKQLRFHFQPHHQRGFTKHPWGFVEPTNCRALSYKKLDIILLPLVAFSSNGYRLGMGGGFYDRALSYRNPSSHHHKSMKPILIGVAHEFQKQDGFIVETWDIPCDYIVTDKAIYSASMNTNLSLANRLRT
jgi:5-formyltetrahydrofolate cyclo-ligase